MPTMAMLLLMLASCFSRLAAIASIDWRMPLKMHTKSLQYSSHDAASDTEPSGARDMLTGAACGLPVRDAVTHGHLHIHPSESEQSHLKEMVRSCLRAGPVHERGGHHSHEHVHDLHAHAGQRCIGDAPPADMTVLMSRILTSAQASRLREFRPSCFHRALYDRSFH